MSGHPQQQGHYDDGYGHHQQGNTESYYQDEGQGYYDQQGAYPEQGHHQGGDGYYDESYVSRSSDKVDRRTDQATEATTMLMPTIHTTKTEDITRARSMAGSTRTNTIMINTTTKAPLLRASTHRAKATQSAEEIRKKIRKRSVISR
jgi:hypothetical protein